MGNKINPVGFRLGVNKVALGQVVRKYQNVPEAVSRRRHYP